MDGEDEENSGGEYSPTSDYLIVTATSFLSFLLRNGNHVKVQLLDQLASKAIC